MQRNGAPAGRGTSSQYRGQNEGSTGRSVITERTGSASRSAYGNSGRTAGRGSGKSVTIGTTTADAPQGTSDDYEELF